MEKREREKYRTHIVIDVTLRNMNVPPIEISGVF